MAFQEAFNVVTQKGEVKLEANTGLFRLNESVMQGGVLNDAIQNLSKTTEKHVAELNKIAKGQSGMDKDELRLALHAMEDELESRIPPNFKERYRRAETPEKAAEMIKNEILTDLYRYILPHAKEVINKETNQVRRIPTGAPSRAAYLSQRVAGLTKVDKANAEALLRDLNTVKKEGEEVGEVKITQAEIDALWQQYEGSRNAAAAKRAHTRRERADLAMKGQD